MAYASGWSSIIELETGREVSDAYDNAFTNIDLALADIDVKLNGAGYDSIIFKPQATEPTTLIEGMMFYDLPTHSFVAIDDIDGTRLNLGHEVNERAFNPDGITAIPEGRVVAVTATDANAVIEVAFADATTLDTAVAFGMTTSILEPNGIGKVTKLGRVNTVDTAGIAVNGTVYLSEVGDGSLTGTPPPIATVIGYVIKAQSAAGIPDGIIYVNPQNIIALPNVVAFMNQDTPWVASVSLDNTPIVLDDYDVANSNGIIMDYVPATGVITASGSGIFDVVVNFETNYDDIGNTVSHLLIEVVEDNLVPVARSRRELGRNSISNGGSFTKTFNATKDSDYTLRISCDDATLTNFVLENISFSLKSIDIR